MFSVGDRVEFQEPRGNQLPQNGALGTIIGDYLDGYDRGLAFYVKFDGAQPGSILDSYATGGILASHLQKVDDSKDFEFDV